MKNSIHLIHRFFFIFLMISQACNNESEGEKNQIAAEVERATEKLHQSFFEFEVFGGPETEIFQVQNDGMNGIYGLTRDVTENLEGDEQNLFDCFQTVSPSVFQLLNLRNATNSFSECRGIVSPSYLEEIRAMVHIREQERVVLFGRYYQNELSEAEVEIQLEKMQAEIRAGANEIKSKYSDEFRACLFAYITDIQGSLNRDQWIVFLDCV